MSDAADLVSVYQANNPTEAYFVKNLLEARGIEAAVSEANEPLAGLPIAAVDVLVKQGDLAAAEAVRDEFNRDVANRHSIPNWKCAQCGEMVPATFDECYACGADRPA
ncbi:MAG: DUF2007 domain-containing protein [Planctomycetaceae bacterium]|nr:DUF2007 domain-containing protein [Planctomycetaceae bacterium]